MARFVKGDVVVVPFPFSDLSQAKRRPALVMANLRGDDLILCQITSQAVKDSYAVAIADADFAEGGLKQPSHIRPTASLPPTPRSSSIAWAGSLPPPWIKRLIESLISFAVSSGRLG